MPVEKQVMVIFAVTNGFLDQLPVSEIKAWEAGFLDYVSAQYPQVGSAIRQQKAMSKETEAELKRAIEAFNQSRGTGKAA
jgi:F-type H+-transporting ATPase subunit alpha